MRKQPCPTCNENIMTSVCLRARRLHTLIHSGLIYGTKDLQSELHTVPRGSLVPYSSFPFPHYYLRERHQFFHRQSKCNYTATVLSTTTRSVKLNSLRTSATSSLCASVTRTRARLANELPPSGHLLFEHHILHDSFKVG